MVKRSLYLLALVAMAAWGQAALADLAPEPLAPPRGGDRSWLIAGAVVAIVVAVAAILFLRRRR
jgi:hypothetical protein